MWLVLFALLLPKPCSASGPPPQITTQPTNQTVLLNASVTFAVSASSQTTVYYQWLFNGWTIPGATSSSYTMAHAQSTDQGTYSVRLVNAGGWALSSNATLTILIPPSVSAHPQSQTVTQGQSATLWLEASGSPPMGYQWCLNGTILPGATAPTLALTNAQPSSAGNYTVVATNAAGSVTSAVVTLTVLPPTPTSLSSSGMNLSGFKFQMSAATGFTYVISASTNLRDWTPFSTNVALTTNVTVYDPAATNFDRRFYRAKVQ
jgi:hypothetical protein